MDNLCRKMEILRKNKKDNLEVKNTNKNEECLHNGLPIRWDLVEERIYKLENITVGISKAKNKPWEEHSRTEGQLQNV